MGVFHSNVRSFPSDGAQRKDSVADSNISKKSENDVSLNTATTSGLHDNSRIARKEPIEPPIRNDGTLDYDGTKQKQKKY